MVLFSTHRTFHALYVYSHTEPGSQMARAPTRTAETVGAPKCSVPLKICLEVTVLKGHCHGYLKYMQYIYIPLTGFSKSQIYLKIFKKILNLIFKG